MMKKKVKIKRIAIIISVIALFSIGFVAFILSNAVFNNPVQINPEKIKSEQINHATNDSILEAEEFKLQPENQLNPPIIETTKKNEPSNLSGNKEMVKNTVAILYYHAINDKIDGIAELFVSPAEFEKQMQYLKDNEYTVISFDQLDKIEGIKKPAIITFDDGYEDNYTYAYPILKKYQFKATIFLTTGVIDKSIYLKKTQIEEMKDLVSIQSHTVNHKHLTEISAQEVEFELLESKKVIGEITGKEATVLAYPFGEYNDLVEKLTKKTYQYAVDTQRGHFQTGDNHYRINRFYIPRSLSIEAFKRKIALP